VPLATTNARCTVVQRALVADGQGRSAIAPASVWYWQRRSGARLHSCRFADRLPLSAVNARPKRNGHLLQRRQNDLPILHPLCALRLNFGLLLVIGRRAKIVLALFPFCGPS